MITITDITTVILQTPGNPADNLEEQPFWNRFHWQSPQVNTLNPTGLSELTSTCRSG